MLKLFLPLALLLFANIDCRCQDASIFDRISGVDFKGPIYLNIDKDGNFFYAIDDEEHEHMVSDDLYFKIKNNHRNDFQIYIQFYNPLSTSIKSSQKDLDDPAYQAISDFIGKLPTGTTKNATETADKATVSTKSSPLNESTLLNEWLYKFIALLDFVYIDDSAKLSLEYAKVVSTLNDIEKTESFLYGSFVVNDIDDRKERSVNDWAKFCSESLFKAGNNYDIFETTLTNSGKILNELVDEKKTASDNLSKIITLMTTDFDVRIKPLIAKKIENNRITSRADIEIDAFKKYSSAFSKSLTALTKPQFTLNDLAINQLTDLNKKLGTFRDDFKDITKKIDGTFRHYKKDYSEMLTWKSTKMKSFTYTFQSLNMDGSEVAKSAKNAGFIVSKKLGVYPFVSTGLIATNISYPVYAISSDNGVNKVAKLDDEKVNVRPTIFLNMLITNWDPVYPFFQIGVTTGKSDVLFPVGFGISIGSSFSVAAGCIFGTYKDLNHLQVGGEVKDDAALQSDLTQKALFKPYFSINYNLGKK